MNRSAALALLALLAAMVTVVVAWWWHADRDYVWDVAEPFPVPDVPLDNPMTRAKVELGRRLFYDTRLSVNGSTACATCHRQSLAFTDGRAQSVGALGDLHPRSAMTLVNSAYASRLTWANPLLDRLEDQALVPLFGDNPIEMGMAGQEPAIIDLLTTDVTYRRLLPKAFPNDADPRSVLNVVRAISAFVRTIISFESPYDVFLRGDVNALSDTAQRGLDLFFSERLECFHCHGGFNFTDSTTHADANVERVGFHNNGLYNIGDNGGYPDNNTGLYDMTGKRRDMGRFKAPTLRNIAVTAPYMHDGSLATLDQVIDHYSRGGRLVVEEGQQGDGRLSPYKSEFIRGFELSPDERADLIAFLGSLTDARVQSDSRWSSPFTDTSKPVSRQAK